MKYIKKFEDHSSTDFYLNFKKSDFLDVIKFDDPKSKYKMIKFIPSMNSVQVVYELDSEINDDNPYKGDISDILTINFSVTYEMNNQSKTCFFKIISGNQTWLEFSYSNGEFSYIDIIKCELSIESNEEIKKLLNKYSK